MIKDILNEFIKILWSNKRKFIGACIGFSIGTMIIIIGFLKTLFILVCTAIGYILGGKSYNKDRIKDWLERILPPGGIG